MKLRVQKYGRHVDYDTFGQFCDDVMRAGPGWPGGELEDIQELQRRFLIVLAGLIETLADKGVLSPGETASIFSRVLDFDDLIFVDSED